MKKLYSISMAILLYIGAIYLSAFQTPTTNQEAPNIVISRQHGQKLLDFQQAVLEFKAANEALSQDTKTWERLREAHTNCRLQYKRIEFLTEYLDAEFVKFYLNGAPLPRLEQKTTEIKVEEPLGLQVLEENIYVDNPYENKESIDALMKQFVFFSDQIVRFQKRTLLEDRFIFEAVRKQLIRVITLGLTGFDTPVTLNAIPEAQASLGSTYDALQIYFPLLKEKDPQLQKRMDDLYKGALKYLADNQDFGSFDRLHFLKTYINPLYTDVKTMHVTLGYPTTKEALAKITPKITNYDAENIFSEDLINPYYYTNVSQFEVNSKIEELGRTLFFDPIMSATNKSSCATCHNPELAFTDGLKKSRSLGSDGDVGRNAPTLFNVAYAERYFYDLRSFNLEAQLQHVVFNKKEFNTSMVEIMERVSQSEEYTKLFKAAFKNPYHQAKPVNPYTISASISAYLATLKSFNSPFDKYVRGEQAEIEESVKRGFNIFMGKAACGTCHFAPTFSGLVPPSFNDSESEVLGVPSNKDVNNPILDPDLGRAMGEFKDRSEIYNNSFKTTTVRNVALTAPYMHNGVYDTLEEVVDFYNRGGGAGMGLDIPNQTLPFDKLDLTEQEQKDLVAFMKALTDVSSFQGIPSRLPEFPAESGLNDRKIGGEY